MRSVLRTKEAREAWDILTGDPGNALGLWDLNGATLELAPSGGEPRLDPDVRRELPLLGKWIAINGILTGWANKQVEEIGLAAPYCHVWGQLACEHWDCGTQTRRELVAPSPGLSVAYARLREVVKDLGLDASRIYVRSHSLAFLYPGDTDQTVVERLVSDLGDIAEAAGDLTLLRDHGFVKLAPAGLDKVVALRRILKHIDPFKPSVILNVGDAPDRVLMEELGRIRREDGIPTLRVGVRNLRDEVDLFLPGPPRGVLPFIRALSGALAQ
ncbi:hypothetical protein GWI34_21465 [Actinomadura sp. DSM 109109]|nr:hypothetical protein [Actinomadura lepetitiana]